MLPQSSFITYYVWRQAKIPEYYQFLSRCAFCNVLIKQYD